MDVIDAGSELAEKQTELYVELVRLEAAKGGLRFKGFCYNHKCEEPLTDRNFCDPACRNEYEHFIKRKR